MTVRTRFAPSPTGYLHIGGVRTALFNWLFARHHGGTFVLRIDDTDRDRNVEEALQPILDGFRWLGLDWDEGPGVGGPHGPYRQSERSRHYAAAVDRLLGSGHAYRDYATPEELETERMEARAAGRSFVYSRRWMAATPAEGARFEAEGRAAVVRLKMPRDGACRFRDLVRGPLEFEWAREQDHVIQRADGSCLYHLANVVDDEDMRITHVIRAEEHLANTPRQLFIAEGLDLEPPAYAHLPFVAEPGSHNKLSKRKIAKYLKNPDFARVYEHGRRIAEAIGAPTDPDLFNPVVVRFYETVGYLPEAVVNYLLLVGWALDDRTEEFTREEMIRLFSLEKVSLSPASFDAKKLFAFQERHAQSVPAAVRHERTLPYAERAGWIASPPSEAERARVAAVVDAAGERIKVWGDVLDYGEFFVTDRELPYEEKAFAKRLGKPDAAERLAGLRARLAAADDFSAAALDGLVRTFVEEHGIAVGDVIHALRVAVTGKAVGFGMFETLEILGRESCLARIDRALELAGAPARGSGGHGRHP
jgi:glutamyl-tRNA synthetase